MIKWVRVLPHAALPSVGRGASFTGQSPAAARRGEQGQPDGVESRTATRCKTDITAPGFHFKRAATPALLSGAPGGSRSGTRRIFTPSEANTWVSKLRVQLQFYFPPFSSPLPLAQSSSLRGEDALSASLPGQDGPPPPHPKPGLRGAPPPPHVTPTAAPEELEIKEDGTGNFKFPLLEVAGDTEATAGSFREPRCRAEDKPRTAPAEELGPPHTHPGRCRGANNGEHPHETSTNHLPATTHGLSRASKPPRGRGTKAENHPSSPFHK